MRPFYSSLLIVFILTGCIYQNSPTERNGNGMLSIEKEEKLQEANILNNQGTDAYIDRNYKLALNYFHKSLLIKEQVLGTEDLNTATGYNNLGLIYKKKGDFKKALVYIKKALKIREKLLGQNSSATAESYNNLGTLYAVMGKNSTAIDLTKKTVQIKKNIIKKEKTDMAISYSNLAVLNDREGNIQEAINYYKQALEINQQIFGEAHDITQQNYQDITQLYFAIKDYSSAKAYAEHIVKPDEQLELEDITVNIKEDEELSSTNSF